MSPTPYNTNIPCMIILTLMATTCEYTAGAIHHVYHVSNNIHQPSISFHAYFLSSSPSSRMTNLIADTLHRVLGRCVLARRLWEEGRHHESCLVFQSVPRSPPSME